MAPAGDRFDSDCVVGTQFESSQAHHQSPTNRGLKKNGSFLVPDFAKFVVVKKPAAKERAGINPFTKEPTVFKARPARKIIRAVQSKQCELPCR
jgi:hypothetical protein